MTTNVVVVRPNFRKYDHLERLDAPMTAGLLHGKVYVFPKLDGTNASVWFDSGSNTIECGSRNNLLHEKRDNHGFRAWLHSDTPHAEDVRKLVTANPGVVFYGEWLVPHSVKNYVPEAWKKFYIFDAHANGRYLPFDTIEKMAENLGGVLVIPPLAVLDSPSLDQLVKLASNGYMCQEGTTGEGIVCKNYDWANRFGHQPWGKLVVTRGAPKAAALLALARGTIEEQIVAKFIDQHFVDKTRAKCATELGVPTEASPEQFLVRHKLIPRMLGVGWHEFVTEEAWNIVKQFKNPTVNYNALNGLFVAKVKELAPDLF